MNNKLLTYTIVLLCVAYVSERSASGATGCTLNDPDRDIRKIFPDATGYKTEFISIEEKGGQKLADRLESTLKDELDSKYEALDVPYAYYDVLKGREIIGRVHGVNQKGKYGGMQLITATDTNGVIVAFYYQKISSPESRRFRDKEFTDLFISLTLDDFIKWKNAPPDGLEETKIGRIKDPTEKSRGDFEATLRGMMKNLFLLQEFKLNPTLIKRKESDDDK